MNPKRKWDFLFMAAADPEYTTARNFWEKEVKDNVISYSSFRKSFDQITAGGTVLDNMHPKGTSTYNQTTLEDARKAKGNAKHRTRIHTNIHHDIHKQIKSINICRDFNEGREGHSDRFYCSNGRAHICAICGQPHPQHSHDRPKGKDKGKDKGKSKSFKGKKGKK
jgi:hypothetical protein